jgi:hypothetical protein
MDYKKMISKAKQIITMDNRGQAVIDTVTGVVIGLVVLILIVFALLLGLASLNPGSFFTAGSVSQNATNAMVNNFTTGLGGFFGQIPIAFTIMGIVLILSFLALLVAIVLRFRGAGSGSL